MWNCRRPSWQNSLLDSDELFEMWKVRGTMAAILGKFEYAGSSPEVAEWATDQRPLAERIPEELCEDTRHPGAG